MATNIISEFAFEQTMRLAGGQDQYSLQVVALIWAECYRNEKIIQLSKNYLYGMSEIAERNLERLNAELRSVFQLDPVA